MPSYKDSETELNFFYYGDDDATAGQGKGIQNFLEIVKESLATGKTWEDPAFPATEASLEGLDLNYEAGTPMRVEWRRPGEIASEMFGLSEPLLHGKYSQFDVKQGLVGDCWFLCVLADAATKPQLINTLIPEDNKTYGFKCGVFHFRFWCRGKWIDVPVDDRLPCRLDLESGEIEGTILSQPTEEGGFWAALLEKAYAKIYGKYSDISGGSPEEAMMDFTGGVIENYEKKDLEGDKLKKVLVEAVATDCLIGFGTDEIPLAWRVRHEGQDPGQESVSVDGMAGGHAYTILDIQDLEDKRDARMKYTVVSVRNPWGTDTEWNGDFSDKDKSGLWKTVTRDLRIGTPDDGQFWMPIEHLRRYLMCMFVCRWGCGYRGDETIEAIPGAVVLFIDNSNFSEKNSGIISSSRDLQGKGGYLANLKPLPESVGNGDIKNGLQYNCGLCVNMLYKNYISSGENAHIPEFGFYLFWSEGENPSEFIYMAQGRDVLFDGIVTENERGISYRGDLPAGTVLIIPKSSGVDDPYLIRIIVEGNVEKLEPYEVKELDLSQLDLNFV